MVGVAVYLICRPLRPVAALDVAGQAVSGPTTGSDCASSAPTLLCRNIHWNYYRVLLAKDCAIGTAESDPVSCRLAMHFETVHAALAVLSTACDGFSCCRVCSDSDPMSANRTNRPSVLFLVLLVS